MFWEKIGNSVSDRLFRVSVRDSVIAENQCLYKSSWRCSVIFIRSKCNEGCDWCIYVTVVTCADTLTSTLCIQ